MLAACCRLGFCCAIATGHWHNHAFIFPFAAFAHSFQVMERFASLQLIWQQQMKTSTLFWKTQSIDRRLLQVIQRLILVPSVGMNVAPSVLTPSHSMQCFRTFQMPWASTMWNLAISWASNQISQVGPLFAFLEWPCRSRSFKHSCAHASMRLIGLSLFWKMEFPRFPRFAQRDNFSKTT